MSEFDDLFRSRFKDHEAEVPDDMWSRIQANQAPDDVKKPVFAFWKISFGILTLLAFIGVSFFYLNKPAVKHELPYIENDAGRSFATFDPAKSNDLSKLLVASHLAEQEQLPFTSELEEITSTLQYNSHNVDHNHKEVHTRNYKITNTVEHSANIPAVEEQQYEVIEKVSDVMGIKIIDPKPHVDESTLSILKNLEGLQLDNSKLFELGLPEYDKKCPKFGKSYHGYYSAEIYHGSDIAIKKIESRIAEFNDFAADRKNTEKQRYSYSNGFRIKWHNSSGLELGMGLERSVIRERFEFMDKNAREVKTLISIDTVFSSNGTFTTSTDTTRIVVPGSRENKITNTYTSIDLPIFIGYQFEINRWAIGLQAGIYINLVQQQKGKILGLTGEPTWIDEDNVSSETIFKSKSGLKFDGAISIVYHLTSNIDVLAQPYFRYNRRSITKENYPLEQFFNTTGIRVGVRYNFGF